MQNRGLVFLTKPIEAEATSHKALEVAAAMAALDFQAILILLEDGVLELEESKFQKNSMALKGFWESLSLYGVEVGVCCDDWNARLPKHTKPKLGNLLSRSTLKHLIHFSKIQVNF